MKKLQCRHDRFPIFAAPPISDRSDNGNPSIALHWSFFIFVPFTRRHRVPRAHINSNKFNAVLCTLIHFMNAE